MQSDKDWRWLIVLSSLLFYLLVLLFVEILQVASQKTILQIWGVPAFSDLFVDLYGVVAWLEIRSAGGNPFLITRDIPLPSGETVSSFLMNYPSTVFLLDFIGLSRENVWIFGYVFILLYLTSILFLAGKCSSQSAILWTLFVLSPISVLLLERGNLDVVIFILLVGAMLCLPRYLWSTIMLVFGTALKIFPFLALPAFFHEPNKKKMIYGVFFAFFSIGFFTSIAEELPLLSAGLNNAYSTSFGAPVVANQLFHFGRGISDATAWAWALRLLAVLCALMAFVLGVGLCWKFSLQQLPEKYYFGILTGTGIFCTSFFSGPQMDYKWIFLLLALPGVIYWVEGKSSIKRILVVWVVVALLYSYWTLFSGESSLRNALLKQGVSWVLYFLSSMIFSLAFFHKWSIWWKDRLSQD